MLYLFPKKIWATDTFVTLVLPNFRSLQIFLTIFLCLLFAEKINFLLGNQQNFSQLKMVLMSKQNILQSRNFSGLDATNELYSEKKICSSDREKLLKFEAEG